MKKIILSIVVLFIFQNLVFSQQEIKSNNGKIIVLYNDGTWKYADSIPLYNIKVTNIPLLEIPKTNTKDKIINHVGYSLLYNEIHEQANWVAYELTKDETNKIFDRTNKFLVDQSVKSGSATDKDYENSGYDRGHLAPASDMGWSEITMEESFYYSNMSPQDPSFNRGIWKKLEESIRAWAIENNSLYIATGPILSNNLQTIGPNKVSVPNYYYKVILDYSEPGIKGIGFILPNIGSKEELQNYAVSIDSVESLTGIDFFPLLDDDQETLIEKSLCVNCWTWKNSKIKKDDNESKSTESVQCNGITKAGNRCKNKTLNISGFCYHHESQSKSNYNKNEKHGINDNIQESSNTIASSVQCSGTTKAGNRCKRMTKSSSGRCYQH
jgi:endonuclease G